MWQPSRIVPGLTQYLAAKGLALAPPEQGPENTRQDLACTSRPSSIQLDPASPQIQESKPARPLPLPAPNPPAKRVKVDAPVLLRPSKSSDALHSDAVLVLAPSASKSTAFPKSEKSTDDLPPLLRASLLPFQTEGVAFAINKGGRVLIGDDMGLGKTIQAISLCWLLREHWPVLIVMPASMRAAWAEELERWLPALHPGSIKMWYREPCLHSHSSHTLNQTHTRPLQRQSR